MSVTTPTNTAAQPTAPAAPTTRQRPEGPLRMSGGVLGILVFLGGVALLLFVFTTAIRLFETPPPPLPAPPPPGADGKVDSSGAMMTIAQSLRDFVLRFFLLLLMCIAGSAIASRGIDLFFKACTAAPSGPATPPAPATQKP